MRFEKKKNILLGVKDGVASIDVSTPKFPGAVVTIDEADIPLILDDNGRWSCWGARGAIYAYRRQQKSFQLMHRLILGVGDGEAIGEHKDHNGLNNRRGNLRPATQPLNCRNRRSRKGSTSAYVGVSLRSKDQKWVAQRKLHGKSRYLGSFDDELSAARAYDGAVRDDPFANRNFQ